MLQPPGFSVLMSSYVPWLYWQLKASLEKDPCVFPSGYWKQVRVAGLSLSLAADCTPILPALSTLACECLFRDAHNTESHGCEGVSKKDREQENQTNLTSDITPCLSFSVD